MDHDNIKLLIIISSTYGVVVLMRCAMPTGAGDAND